MTGWAPLSYGSTLRGLSAAHKGSSQALSHLSTGKRIVRASDDAAGAAVAAGLTARVRCGVKVEQALRTGMSILGLAEGGLGSISSMLIRGRELALQACSDGIGDNERGYLQIELRQILQEIDHTASTTRWGNESPIAAVHADVGFLLDVSGSMAGEIAAVRAALTNFRAACVYGGVDVAFGLATVGDDRDDQAHRQVDIGGAGFDSRLESLPLTGWLQDPYAALLQTAGVAEFPTRYWDPDAFTWRQSATRHIIQLTDTGRETDVVPDGFPDDEASVASAVAAQGVAVHIVAPRTQHGVFDAIAAATGGSLHDIGPGDGSGIAAVMDAIAHRIAALGESREPLEFIAGYGASDRVQVAVSVDATATGLGLSNTDVSTKAGALDALNRFDSAIDEIVAARASFGAQSNRLQSLLNQQQRSNDSSTAARMEIEDADIARTSTELLRHQVLTQSGQQVMTRLHDLNRNLLLTLIS